MLISNNTHAMRIYKSIDAEGNVTYSSFPPSDAKQVEKMHVPQNFDAGASTDENTTHDQIKAAGKELEEDRKQREQAREAAQKEHEEETRTYSSQPVEEHRHYYPVYPLYRHHVGPRPPRPPHYPRPPHPPRPHPTPAPQQPMPRLSAN